MSKTSNIKALIKTDYGDIHINLFHEKTPITVANFVNLAERGYYDNLNFHRVLDNFMIQGGCPKGTGVGGPGYQFDDEIVSELKHNKPGVLSMANAGPGTNGSQFFITHVETPWLDGKHTVFGEVVGDPDQAMVNMIQQGDSINRIEIVGDTSAVKEAAGAQLAVWNDILDEGPDNDEI